MKRISRKKVVLASSMFVIALFLGGSTTAFAAQDVSTSYGYLAGQQENSSRHAQYVASGSSDAESGLYKAAQGIVGHSYSEAQQLNTSALVTAGLIDQATADRIQAYASAKHDSLHAQHTSLSSMTDAERHAFYASIQSSRFSGSPVEALLDAGLITQEQADAIQAYLG